MIYAKVFCQLYANTSVCAFVYLIDCLLVEASFLAPPVPVCTHASDLKIMGRCVSVAVIELHCS